MQSKNITRNIYLTTLLAAAALTAVIWLTAGALQSRFEVVNEKYFAFFYPWQTRDPSTMAYITAWVGYALHNILAWGVIFAAQRAKPKYDRDFRWFNWTMLGINAGGYALHWVQTQIWYDGLAIAVPEVTSQGSVVLMLVFILIIENPRRGLFFGKKVNFKQRFTQIVRRYHGYLFSWGIIYTFWYHPMENTFGHLAGFFYMFLLLAQSVLIFNRAHVNKYWTFALEAVVLVHGTLVAIYQGNGLWPMFFFGFAAMIAVTQIYGLGLEPWVTRLIGVAFAVGAGGFYFLTGNLAGINEVFRIPVVEYGLVFAFYLVFFIINWIVGLFRRPKATEAATGAD
jgi:hypothetical protein